MAYDTSLTLKQLVNEALHYLWRPPSALPAIRPTMKWLQKLIQKPTSLRLPDVAEVRQLQDAAEGKRKYLSALTTRLLLITGNTRACSATFDHDWEGCLAHSNMSTISMGLTWPIPTWCQWQGAPDAELAEYVEDRGEKQLNTSVITMTSGIRF